MSTIISYANNLSNLDEIRAQSPSAAAAQGTQYALRLINQSAQPWYFFVYQKMPGQVRDLYSLVWFCSPYQIRKQSSIRFVWELGDNFVWSDTGQLIPGVDFQAGGVVNCDRDTRNTTEFSLDTGPGFSTPIAGQPTGSLNIRDAANVPNNRFSVGIGMSGFGTFAVQAGTNLTQMFSPGPPNYWIAAGSRTEVGSVLSIDTIVQTAEAKFPSAVFDLDCTLKDDNTWKITPGV